MQEVPHFSGKTTLNDTTSDETFAILQAYFGNTEMIEKYPTAMINFMLNESLNQVIGDSKKQRISKKKLARVRDVFIKKLRTSYGKWMNITSFEQRRNEKILFTTNFTSTYKTSKGVIYGHNPHSRLRQLFFTAHSLKRFEERVNPNLYSTYNTLFKRATGVLPTVSDILSTFVLATRQYGVEKDYRYLNVFVGALVIETFRNIFIVKTFLNYDMLKPADWFQLILNDFEKQGDGKITISSVQELFDHKCELCNFQSLDRYEENISFNMESMMNQTAG